MKNTRGEVATIVTLSVMIVAAVTTVVFPYFMQKNLSKSSRATANKPNLPTGEFNDNPTPTKKEAATPTKQSQAKNPSPTQTTNKSSSCVKYVWSGTGPNAQCKCESSSKTYSPATPQDCCSQNPGHMNCTVPGQPGAPTGTVDSRGCNVNGKTIPVGQRTTGGKCCVSGSKYPYPYLEDCANNEPSVPPADPKTGPKCNTGGYSTFSYCQDVCGPNNCVACIAGTQTQKYECGENASGPACSKDMSYGTLPNCQSKCSGTCTRCGEGRWECDGDGTPAKEYPTQVPTKSAVLTVAPTIAGCNNHSFGEEWCEGSVLKKCECQPIGCIGVKQDDVSGRCPSSIPTTQLQLTPSPTQDPAQPVATQAISPTQTPAQPVLTEILTPTPSCGQISQQCCPGNTCLDGNICNTRGTAVCYSPQGSMPEPAIIIESNGVRYHNCSETWWPWCPNSIGPIDQRGGKKYCCSSKENVFVPSQTTSETTFMINSNTTNIFDCVGPGKVWVITPVNPNGSCVDSAM